MRHEVDALPASVAAAALGCVAGFHAATGSIVHAQQGLGMPSGSDVLGLAVIMMRNMNDAYDHGIASYADAKAREAGSDG
jgi:hypothetical protein